jgi:hypothetical protein
LLGHSELRVTADLYAAVNFVSRLPKRSDLFVLLVGTAATAQVQIGTRHGFEVTVAKGVTSGEFVVDVTVTDLANAQIVARPQLLGPANTALTLVGTNGDYEYRTRKVHFPFRVRLNGRN